MSFENGLASGLADKVLGKDFEQALVDAVRGCVEWIHLLISGVVER